MKTIRLFGPMIVLAVGLSVAGIFLPDPWPAAYAQRPTPTNIPSGPPAGEPGPGEPGGPSRTGTVSGLVFNYSTGRPQGGMGVVLDGGGWAAETVSDSEGRYIFRGLGSGPATLRLRLPEGATPVNPDLLVYTGPGLEVNVNLGYYTGDRSPVPVLLTGAYAPVEGATDRLMLNLLVENRGTIDVTGVLVDARLPAGQQIMSAQVSQGWADAVGLRAQVHLGDLAQGRKASVSLLINLSSPEAAEKAMRATLTYDQQMTSQIVDVVASRSGAVKMPVTGQETTQTSPVSLLLVALVMAAFGCSAVLMARLNHQR